VPLSGTHEIIRVPKRGGFILVKYTRILFKFVNLSHAIGEDATTPADAGGA
jgi:hypothetical protein